MFWGQKERLNKFRNTAPNKIETLSVAWKQPPFLHFRESMFGLFFSPPFFLATFLFLSVQARLPFTTLSSLSSLSLLSLLLSPLSLSLSLSLLTVNRTVSAENKLFLLLRVLSIVVMTGLVPHAILRKWPIRQNSFLETHSDFIMICYILAESLKTF